MQLLMFLFLGTLLQVQALNGCSPTALSSTEMAPARLYACTGSWVTPGWAGADTLCASGFRVCRSLVDAARMGLRAGTGAGCSAVPPGFYATAGACTTDNAVYGCVRHDAAFVQACHDAESVLNARMPANDEEGRWSYNPADISGTVLHNSTVGGVLCCAHPAPTMCENAPTPAPTVNSNWHWPLAKCIGTAAGYSCDAVCNSGYVVSPKVAPDSVIGRVQCMNSATWSLVDGPYASLCIPQGAWSSWGAWSSCSSSACPGATQGTQTRVRTWSTADDVSETETQQCSNPCPVVATCGAGYTLLSGDIPDFGTVGGRGGGESVASCQECANLCSSQGLCNSYECSPTELRCNLNTAVKPTSQPYRDWMFCSVGDLCASGYTHKTGDVPGWGKVNNIGGGKAVANCDECATLCTQQNGACKSYECSPTHLKCNLNTEPIPTAAPYLNYRFCAISKCHSGYSEKDGDIPGWGAINSVGGGQSVTDCNACGTLCNNEPLCKSYECSPTKKECNLNTGPLPTATSYQDFAFCSKDYSGSSSLVDNAQQESGNTVTGVVGKKMARGSGSTVLGFVMGVAAGLAVAGVVYFVLQKRAQAQRATSYTHQNENV